MRFFLLPFLFALWLNMDVSVSQNEPLGCGTPPFLVNGDIKDSMKQYYSHNESVEYMCQKYYIMEGGPNRTCINGEWTGQMRCLQPCTVTADDMRHRNIEFKYTAANAVYSPHNDVIDFKCTQRRPVNNVGLRPKCNDGVMLLPSCQ